MKSVRQILVWGAAALLVVLGGCGEDESPSQEPGQDVEIRDTPGLDDTNNPGEAALVEDTALRISFINIRRPSTASLLTNLIQADINSGLLNVAIVVRDFEETTDGYELRITGNAAALEGDSYVWGPTVEDVVYVRAGYDPGTGTLTGLETFSLNFPAPLPGSEEVVELPLREIQLDASWVLADGTPTLSGELLGVILRSDADEIEVELTEGQPTKLTALLGTSNLNWPEGGENALGWRLIADIVATPVPFSDF